MYVTISTNLTLIYMEADYYDKKGKYISFVNLSI